MFGLMGWFHIDNGLPRSCRLILKNLQTQTLGGKTFLLKHKSLRRHAHNVARYLKNQGAEVGDKIAMIFPASSPEFLVALYACQVCLVH